MPVLFEIFGVLLLASGTFLFLSARETAQENRRMMKQFKSLTDQLQAVELRLRHVENHLCEQDPSLTLTESTPRKTDATQRLPPR